MQPGSMDVAADVETTVEGHVFKFDLATLLQPVAVPNGYLNARSADMEKIRQRISKCLF